ncbi:MAG: hypothetical protein IT236_15405, partial [Bacteroidia bacterium]|nr:hypothetical protein [Bacteroidia bacterium]
KGYYFARSNSNPTSRQKVNTYLSLHTNKKCKPVITAVNTANSVVPTEIKTLSANKTMVLKTEGKLIKGKLNDRKNGFPFVLNNKTTYAIGINKENSIGKSEDNEERSLFWVVVLVLVVLWALGLISGGLGLGILINLLLVIALVLLILWLLRIV